MDTPELRLTPTVDGSAWSPPLPEAAVRALRAQQVVRQEVLPLKRRAEPLISVALP